MKELVSVPLLQWCYPCMIAEYLCRIINVEEECTFIDWTDIHCECQWETKQTIVGKCGY